MKKIAVMALLLAFLAPAFVCSAGELSSFFAQMEPVFPEMYDQKISEMYRPEDKVLFMFREMCRAENNLNSKRDTVLNGYLQKALNRCWIIESCDLGKSIKADPEYFCRRLAKYFSKLPSRFDQAAFMWAFKSFDSSLYGLKQHCENAGMAIEALKKPAVLAEYSSEIAATEDFYRRIPFFMKPVKEFEAKVEGYFERLQQKFLLEKMILALDAFVRTRRDIEGVNLNWLKQKLSNMLVARILSNLENQLEAGLEDGAITGIARSPTGVAVTQVLYQGRIRTFVKEFQKVESASQFASLLPVMDSVVAGLKTLQARNQSTANGQVLARMLANLEQMKIIMQMKMKQSASDSKAFAGLVEDFFSELSGSEASQLLQSRGK